MKGVVTSLLLLTAACSSSLESQAPVAIPYDSQTDSERLTIYWNKAETTGAEAKVVLAKATEFIEKASVLLESKASHRHIFITLDGTVILPTGEKRPPYMDPDGGWVHLFRRHGNYPFQNGLGHELVHALRFEHIRKHAGDKSTWYGFLEEGIAEYFSNLLEPSKETFSVFGQGLTIAAGYWVTNERDIPLDKLVFGHDDLAQKCQAQAYPLRASFYQYLDERYGRKPLLELAYWEPLVDSGAYVKIFGKPFSELGAEWRRWIAEVFLKAPSARERAGSYFRAVTEKKLYVCERIKDFS